MSRLYSVFLMTDRRARGRSKDKEKKKKKHDDQIFVKKGEKEDTRGIRKEDSKEVIHSFTQRKAVATAYTCKRNLMHANLD